jgi:hypothetical protein
MHVCDESQTAVPHIDDPLGMHLFAAQTFGGLQIPVPQPTDPFGAQVNFVALLMHVCDELHA